MSLDREHVRVLMRKRGIGQRELARRMGVAEPQLSRLLHSQVGMTIVMLDRLADALDVSPGDLLKPTDYRSSNYVI